MFKMPTFANCRSAEIQNFSLKKNFLLRKEICLVLVRFNQKSGFSRRNLYKSIIHIDTLKTIRMLINKRKPKV